MKHLALLLVLLAALLHPMAASADPADINAAARGVVRVVVLGNDDGQPVPVSHGSGFVVDGDTIVTNAHVVEESLQAGGLSIGVVPPQGGQAVPARILAYSPRNDLALIRTNSPLKLPHLAISAALPADSALVSSVGYPMNVDRAQGLSIEDVLRPQPPVKSRGFVSGERPSREFDSVLHTAPIARGSSGGPLLDNCGRVVGVNSFGAESGSADAEFYFAVSVRELLPFLRANNVTAQVNGLPCRSIEELNAEELAAQARDSEQAREIARRQEAEAERKHEKAMRAAEMDVLAERDNGMAGSAVLLALALAAGFVTWQARNAGNRRNSRIGGVVTTLAVIGMLTAWFTRPGLDDIEERAADAIGRETPAPAPAPAAVATGEGHMICTLDLARSRVTSAKTDDIVLDWRADGCVAGRTQYGLDNGRWSRVFVPNDEEVVSVNSYAPEKREYRIERFLLDRQAMEAARTERATFQPPTCGSGDEAGLALGAQQAAILAMLPPQPNERLVFRCGPDPLGRTPNAE